MTDPAAEPARGSPGLPGAGGAADGAAGGSPGAGPDGEGSSSTAIGFGSTRAPLAAVHDVALLDLDGVVYVGPDAVPHAAESLDRALAEHGMRSAFVTNNASRPPSAVAEHLRVLGIRAADTDVVTSAQAGARMLAERIPPGAAVLAIGGPGVSEALEERGLRPVRSADDDPVAVLQGYGPDVSWRDLAEGSLTIARGGLFVATNLDRTIPTPRGRVLGNGAMVAALRHGTGVDPLVAGKPEPPLMVESVARSGARRPLVVGDRLDTDIEGATRVGIPSLLVLTGVTTWQDLLGAPPELRPTHVGWDLRALLEPAPAVDVRSSADSVEARCGRAAAHAPIRPRTGPAPGTAGREWLPPRWRVSGSLGQPELEVVRALVALAWATADRGAQVAGLATVRSGG
jgi:glycerol 3-phosphatase-2